MIKSSRNTARWIGVGAVAVAAFAFGRMTLDTGTALAAPQDGGSGGMDPAVMQALTEAGTPGEHHEHLDTLEGDWQGVFRFRMEPGSPMMESKGTVHREWILDGRFMKETVNATTEYGPFQGIGYVGYDNVEGQYEMVWMDSMGTGIYYETANYDPSTKILHTRGAHPDPVTGRTIHGYGTFDMSSPNRHVMTGYQYGPDGKAFKAFEGVVERSRGGQAGAHDHDHGNHDHPH